MSQIAESPDMTLEKNFHLDAVSEEATVVQDTSTGPPYELSAVEKPIGPAELMSNARYEV
jgi:hypothetical protein